MKYFKTSIAVGAVATAAFATLFSVGAMGAGAQEAAAKPNFQMPFKCGYTATAATFSGHSPSNSVDFQKSGITGDPVLASAGGTVSVVGDEGGTSYGKWIEVDHGGGYTTRYAHLSEQAVKKGQKVNTGTQLGKAGATGGVTGPHLHFEERKDGADIKVTLDGAAVPYFGKKDFTSKNACGGSSNPHTPEEACGSGFSVIDKQALGKAGTSYLLFNASSSENCVATMKESSLDKKTAASAFLEVEGAKRATDSGDFTYYAGPVKAKAENKCVKWGGSAGSEKYTSPFEHCK